VTVAVGRLLSSSLLSTDGEFTITAWFQSLGAGGAISGTVLSLFSSSETDATPTTIYFALAFVQLGNATTAVTFSLQVMSKGDGRKYFFWRGGDSLLLFPSFTFPPPRFPSPYPLPFSSLPLEVGPLTIQLRGLGERCKLPQRGPRRSPSRNRIWCILDLKCDIWWQ